LIVCGLQFNKLLRTKPQQKPKAYTPVFNKTVGKLNLDLRERKEENCNGFNHYSILNFSFSYTIIISKTKSAMSRAASTSFNGKGKFSGELFMRID
jgi:hypothetical protein